MITEQEKLQIRKGVIDREVEALQSVLDLPYLHASTHAALRRRLDAVVAEQAQLMQHPLLVNQEGVSSAEGGWNNPADPGDAPALPLHRTGAGYPRCSTCDGGGCSDCTDPA